MIKRCEPYKFVFYWMLYIVIIFSQSFLKAQEPEIKINANQTDFSDRIENIAQQTEASLDYTELIEGLKYFRENPLNLNYASKEELKELVFLNSLQIYNLLVYRESYGYFLSLYELQTIKGFDRETIQKISPYVKVTTEKKNYRFSPKNILKYMDNKFIVRYQRVLQPQEGYKEIADSVLLDNPNSRYHGSPDKLYFRYGFNYFKKIRLGLTLEKDAGEPFFNNGINDSIQKSYGYKLKSGFDFYSAHLHLNDLGIVKAFSIGDYQLQFGQGLTLWTGMAFGKSADAITIKKFGQGIKPYTSTNENNFFRGMATTIQLEKIDLTAFYSSNKIDANFILADTNTSEENKISSLLETGLHRTPNELANRKNLKIETIGGNITFKQKRLKLGLTVFSTSIDKDLVKQSYLYNYNEFQGSKLFNGGLDYSYLFKRINFYGEISVGKNGAVSQLHGITASLHPNLSWSVLYRYFNPKYQNLFTNALGESSRNINETGFYTGFRLFLPLRMTLLAYVDNFKFPWLKYQVNSPSRGYDVLVQLQHNFNGSVLMYFRWRQKVKQKNGEIWSKYIDPIQDACKNNFRFHIEYAISSSVILKNRVEVVSNKLGTAYNRKGYLIYQDILWRKPEGKFSVVFRYVFFDTDSYDERIYAYENDVLYAFSVPAYYYSGSRCVMMFKLIPNRKINIWLRLAHTWYNDRESIGSGLAEINGNEKTEVKFQLMVKI